MAVPMRVASSIGYVLAIMIVPLTMVLGGCYYPPLTQPPLEKKTRTVVPVPYDLTWDAIHTVVKKNEYKIEGDDPDHGIVEAEAHSFTLADADCGKMRSVGTKYDADPLPGGSAVYNFKVEPAGPQSTDLSVIATYSTPLHVPFERITDFQCISRGNQEARLIREVEKAAEEAHRPVYTAPSKRPLTSGRPTLLRQQLRDPRLQQK
jgi:hypothetical protein